MKADWELLKEAKRQLALARNELDEARSVLRKTDICLAVASAIVLLTWLTLFGVVVWQ
jgi:hypothetical protein